MTTSTQATPHTLLSNVGVPVRFGVFLLLVTVFFSLLGISPMSSLLVVTVLVALTVSGQVLLSWAGFEDLPIGVGLVLGVGMMVFVSQSMLVAGTPTMLANWGSSLAIASAAYSLRRRTAKRLSWIPKVQIDQLEIAFAIAVFALAIRQPWIMPFCFSVVLIVWSFRLSPRKPWAPPTGVLLAAGGYWLSQSLRVENWWYYFQGNDAQFFEALGWSTARFGVFEHPGFAGGSIAAYHWLTYAFFGSLSEFAGLMPWDALMKIGAPLLSFGFASLFLGVMSETKDVKRAEYWIVATLCVLVMPGIRVDSFAFSILIGMAFILTTNQALTMRNQWKSLALFLLFVPTLVFGKVSTAAVVGFILALQLFIARSRGTKYSVLLPLISIAFILGLSVLLFRTSSGSGSLTEFSPSFRKTWGELRNLLESSNFTLQFCFWLIVVLLGRKHARSGSNNLYFALLIAAPLLALGWILQANSTSSYLGVPAIYMLTLLTANRSEFAIGTNIAIKHYLGGFVLFAGSGLIGFGLPTLLNRSNEMWGIAQWARGSIWEIVRGSGFIIAISLLLLVLSASRRRLNAFVATMLLLILLGFTVGSSFDTYRRIHAVGPSGYESWSGNSAPFADDDLREIGGWIQRNTKSNVILASNNFCCAGSDWWQQIVNDPTAHLNGVFGETGWGGANYLLPAESRRRFLIQGLRFQTGSEEPSTDQIKRMTISLEFANKPSQEVVEQLKFYGVSGYVANLTLTEHRDWSAFAVEKFRSGDFVYLELK